MLCGTDNILHDIPHIQFEYKEYTCRILSVPHNNVTNLNNVMAHESII